MSITSLDERRLRLAEAAAQVAAASAPHFRAPDIAHGTAAVAAAVFDALAGRIGLPDIKGDK